MSEDNRRTKEALEVAKAVLNRFASLGNWAGGETGSEWIWAEDDEPYLLAEAALRILEQAEERDGL